MELYRNKIFKKWKQFLFVLSNVGLLGFTTMEVRNNLIKI